MAEPPGAACRDSRSVCRPGRGGSQYHRDDGERDHADGQVDVEDPAPADTVHEEAAEKWPRDARHAEDGAERALILAAFAGRHHVADDCLGEHQETAATQALKGAEADQFAHVLR